MGVIKSRDFIELKINTVYDHVLVEKGDVGEKLSWDRVIDWQSVNRMLFIQLQNLNGNHVSIQPETAISSLYLCLIGAQDRKGIPLQI